MSSLDGERLMAAAAGDVPSLHERTEERDGMRIDWNVPVTMDDGLVLRAAYSLGETVAARHGEFPALRDYREALVTT